MVIMPTQDNIVIKLPTIEKETVTQSGIVLTGSATQQDLPERGVVVAKGPGRTLNNGNIIEIAVNEGDEVIFNKFAGTKITSDATEYLIVKENDILAILK